MTNMAGLGVALRITCHFSQGGRSYMEDIFSIAYQENLDYAYFAIFDGHGGPQAATFAKEHLLKYIVNQRNFWSCKDEDILKAIRDGYIATHYAMWKVSTTWPKTTKGFECSSGCTATVFFIMREKMYIGHVGDSALVLGYQENGSKKWMAKKLTTAHKPNNKVEKQRIEQCGSKVTKKSGVHRVVWHRPKLDDSGAKGDSQSFEDIPFLAVARSLGDFWSYNAALDEFVVSPEPEVLVFPIDVTSHRCLVLGTDGLWDTLSAKRAVSIVQDTDTHNQTQNDDWINPSKRLVEEALKRWAGTKYTADNTSAITLMVGPPTHPQVVIKQLKKCQKELTVAERESKLLTRTSRQRAPRCEDSVKKILPEELCNGTKKLKEKSKSEETTVAKPPGRGKKRKRERKEKKLKSVVCKKPKC